MLKLIIQLYSRIRLTVEYTIRNERSWQRQIRIASFSDELQSDFMEFYTKHRDNIVSKFNFFKAITLALLKDYLALPKQAHFAYVIIIISTYIITNNLIISYHLFYEAFCFKKKILTELGFSKLDWFWPELFLREIPELYFIHELSLFIVSIIWKLVFAILMIIPVLLIIAYSTLLEWKVLSAAQWRRGPNKVGIKGSAQPLIDGVKLILKEIIIPVQSENKIFLLSSIWSIFFMLLLWFIIPTSKFGNIIQLNYELLALFCVSILGSISILLAGWSSNSKYAFLGGVWAGAQMISYDLVLGLVALIVMTVTGSTQIIDIVEFQKLHGPLFLYLPLETSLFLILIVAETNRAPFDFAEAESELVSGYNTEYSGLPFAFFFIAEYGNILYMSLLTSLLFFGGWSTEFLPVSYHDNFFLESLVLFTKTVLVYFFFLWLRAALPRYRYDQLMSLCWKVFLPIALLSLAIWVLTFLNL